MGLLSKAFDISMVYKFIRLLTTPFVDTSAFKLGIIDKDGNVLKKSRQLKTQAEKDAYTYMDRMVFKLKRLLAKVPGGRTILGSYAAALWLISEEVESQKSIENYAIRHLRLIPRRDPVICEVPSKIAILKNDILNEEDEIIVKKGTKIYINRSAAATFMGVFLFEGKINSDSESILVSEDDLEFVISEEGESVATTSPANNIGSGNIATYPTFMGNRVFKVKSDYFFKSMYGKYPPHRYSRYVGLEEEGEEIRMYGRSNPGVGIILQHEMTGEMIFLKRPKKRV